MFGMLDICRVFNVYALVHTAAQNRIDCTNNIYLGVCTNNKLQSVLIARAVQAL